VHTLFSDAFYQAVWEFGDGVAGAESFKNPSKFLELGDGYEAQMGESLWGQTNSLFWDNSFVGYAAKSRSC
jgi:hypothetical protein